MTWHTTTLHDLPGRPGRTVAAYVESRTAAMKAAREGKAATSAGCSGAINVWRRRDGRLCAEFMRHCVTINRIEGLKLYDLALWLKEWWPAMHA